MNIANTKEAVSKLLVATEIVATYYIDDKFQEDAKIDDHFEEFAIAIEERCKSRDIKDIPLNVIEADPANRELEIKKWWGSRTAKEKNQLFNRYADSESKNGYPALLIKELLGNNCTCCDPSSWNANYKNMALSHIKERKPILLLFDQELSNGNTGMNYAATFFNNPNVAEFTYCGIISNQFRIENEFVEREAYQKEQPNYYIYPLSKDRLTIQQEGKNDYEPFLSGLKNILWVKHIENLKVKTEEILRLAFNNTIKRYREIQPPAYKKIIIDSSQKEGCRELDTLLRLLQIILDKEIKESLVTNDFLKFVNVESNVIATIDSNMSKQYPKIDNQAKTFIKDEQFIEGKTLNALFTPLQNGDIFKINNERWILLCQPCNIAIRKKGKRGNNYNTGFLIRLTPSKDVTSSNKLLDRICTEIKNMLSEEDKKSNFKKLNNYKRTVNQLLATENQLNFALDFEIEQESHIVQFNQFRTIDLALLDNVSFNADGNAVINLKQVDAPQMHKNLIDRQKTINQQFKELATNTQHIKTYCNTCEHYSKLNDLFSFIYIDIPYCIEADKITFPIQRIGHYRSPFSEVLLTKFSHYLSRAGFPHSFVEH